MKFDKKKIIPHVTALAIFVLIGFIYCYPVLEKKVISQMDVEKAKGMMQELVEYNKTTGDYSLWTNSMFSGMPSYQIGSPGTPNYNIFTVFNKVVRSILPMYSVDILFLYMLSSYILFLCMGFNPWISIIGAIAFSFSSYNVIIIKAGHVNKALAISIIPAITGGVISIFRQRYITGIIITTLAFGIHMGYNHLQMTYYMFLFLGIFILAEFLLSLKNKKTKTFLLSVAVLIFSLFIGILPNITNILTTYEYSKETMRGGSSLTDNEGNKRTGLEKDYALAWSYGKMETFTLLIPNFHGGASASPLGESSNTYKALTDNGIPENQASQITQQLPTYWGTQSFTAGPVYFGAIICFLFIMGLFLIKSHWRWWLLVSAVLAIMLSWGRNFLPLTNLFFDYFPLYNKFRAVSSILIVANLAIWMLAVYTLNEIINMNIKKEEVIKSLKQAFYITGGLCLFFAMFGPSMFDFESLSDNEMRSAGYPVWLIDAIIMDRGSMLRSDAIRSLIFISLAGVVIWLYLADKLKMNYTLVILGLLVMIDMWGVDKRYMNKNDFVNKREVMVTPTRADLEILKDRDPNFRVFNLTQNPFAETHTSYFHKSIGGYHGAKLSRYQDIIDYHLSKQNMRVLSMLNTKYLIMRGNEGDSFVYPNANALGNAWFINNIEWVKTPNEEIEALSDFNLATTVVINEENREYISNLPLPDTLAEIRLTSYKPNRLTYKSYSHNEGFAVFSEIYYNNGKGWEASIDGKPAKHIQVNYILRGMRIPAGEHDIEFVFKPRTFELGTKITIVSSSFILLLFIGMIGYSVYKKKNEK